MFIQDDNFIKQLPAIMKKIQKAQFISFDCEFSGLKTSAEHGEHQFQSEEQYYQRVKQNCSTFCLFQVGLCIYQYQDNNYVPTCYNFYIKNNTGNKKKSNMIVCQVDCLEFLAKNHMNFQKVFLNGIKSRRLSQKDHIKKEILGQDNQQSESEFQKKQVYYMCEKDQIIYNQIIATIKQKVIKQKTAIKINFHSKFMLKEIQKVVKVILQKQKKVQLAQFQFIVKAAKPDKYKPQKPKIPLSQNQQNSQIISKLGFSTIIEAIILSKKPLVGHFPHLDLAFIYQNFIDQLPQTYYQYCKSVDQIFNFIFDTKVLSKRLQITLKNIRVDLSSLYSACFDEKLLKPYTNINYKFVEQYQYSDAKHEAGYDAFITGCAFIGMVNFINKKQSKEDKLLSKQQIKENKLINFHQIEYNKVFYSKYSGQVKYDGKIWNKFDNKILIIKGPIEQICKSLRKYGNLRVYIRDQIYLKFEQEQNIEKIIQQSKQYHYQIIPYKNRTQFKARKYI